MCSKAKHVVKIPDILRKPFVLCTLNLFDKCFAGNSLGCGVVIKGSAQFWIITKLMWLKVSRVIENFINVIKYIVFLNMLMQRSRITLQWYHNDAIVSPITSLTIVYSTIYSGADQSSVSLAFVKGIHRWSVNSSHKGPVTRKMFPFDDVFMHNIKGLSWTAKWTFLHLIYLQHNPYFNKCSYLIPEQVVCSKVWNT